MARVKEIHFDHYEEHKMDGVRVEMDEKEIHKILASKLKEWMNRQNTAQGELLERCNKAIEEIRQGLSWFKNKDRRKLYDKLLKKAKKEGRFNTKETMKGQSYLEKAIEYYKNGHTQYAMDFARKALDNNVSDTIAYEILAGCYFDMGYVDDALKVLNTALLGPCKNNIDFILKCSRYLVLGKHDFDTAQVYINKAISINESDPRVSNEQILLYIIAGKEDMAFNEYDSYIQKYPNNEQYKRAVASSFVVASNVCYKEDPQSGVMIIASKEDYELCTKFRQKAYDICPTKEFKEQLDDALFYGRTEFNQENKNDIMWAIIGSIIYCTPVLAIPIGAMDSGQSMSSTILMSLLAILVAGLSIALVVAEIKVSYRPYWQINKFYLTNQREKNEATILKIGRIYTIFLKLSVKISIGICLFIWGILIHSARKESR